MLKPLLRPGSQGSRLWSRFSDSLAPLLSMLTLLAFFGVAALAPLLSQDRPIVLEDENGDWTSPLFRSFSQLDWMWLGLFLSVCTGYLVFRVMTPRAGSARAALASGITVLVIAGFLASSSDSFHERRRYRIEQRERQQLHAFDRAIIDESASAEALVAQGRELAEGMGASQLVSLALFERIAVLAEVPLDKAKMRHLARANADELRRLEEAVYPPNRFDPDQPGSASLLTPSLDANRLGSDELGRDVLARLIYGTRTSLTVALGATLLIAVLSLTFGLLGGYFRGLIDRALSRLSELVLCLPALAVLVAAPAWLPRDWRQSQAVFVVFLGCILWPQAARLVRNEVLKTKELDFVRSAVALGLKDRQIIVRHVMPNITPPLLVSLGLTAGNLILLESTLSFLGIGPADQPSWGRMLAESRSAAVVGDAWHLATFPGIAVVATVLAFNLISQAFSRALNPRRS